jgi:CRISPR-associated exonuclease Cas4
MPPHTFRDLETAAYCPRKLYYRRRDGPPDVPDDVGQVRDLAFDYERLLSDDAALLAAPVEVAPGTFRNRIRAARRRLDHWDRLVDPAGRDVFLSGKDARGVAHKVLALPDAGPRPSLVFAGAPPDQGVWEPQSVRLVAAAKALAWEHECEVERAYAEYPAYGTVRRIDLSVRRTGQYRRAVRTADSVDGPPARVANDAKCSPCDYRENCGVQTRSLRSIL